MSSIFTINYKNLIGAVVSGVIVAVLSYLVSITDVWTISWHTLINIAVLTAFSSLLKAFMTNENGDFASVVPVK